MNKNNISMLVGAVVLVVIAYGFYFSRLQINKPVKDEVTPPAQSGKNEPAPVITDPVAINLKDRAWVVFSNYLREVNNHNIPGVKALSYRQSAVCADPKQEKECFALMDDVYKIGVKLKKEDFKNMASDSKQLILSTDPVYFEDSDNYGYRKSFIFFVVENTNLKLLALDPNQEWIVPKNSVPGKQEAIDKLDVYVRDSDNDGITDRVEECPAGTSIADLTCVKTDPKNRDTDGDGWWDGVQVYIPKK